MSYRNDKLSVDREMRGWIKSNRNKLLSLGVCHQTLDDPDSFFHDFILHAYGVGPGMVVEQRTELLRFLSDEWGENVMRPGAWDRLARSIGPNCILCAESGKLEHGQFWFQTTAGASPVTVLTPTGDLAECYVWNHELVWIGCQFRGVRGDYHVASGYVRELRQFPKQSTPTTRNDASGWTNL